MTATRLAALAWLTGCATAVHQVSPSVGPRHDPATASVRLVRSTGEQQVILGFVQQTAYVDAAWARLLDQCRDGELQWVTATSSTQLGFLSYRNQLAFEATCVTPL
jgi:hypothetical protein